MEPRTGAIGKQEPDSRARTRPGTVIGIVLASAALLAVAALLSVVLRTAEIVVTTPRQPVSKTISVGYSADGSLVPGAQMTLPASMTEFTVPYVTTRPATGTLENSGGTAAGMLQLRNITEEAVELPTGTRFESSTGLTFVSTEAVTVPSAESDEPGAATVGVTAEQSGAAGNIPAGVFTGAYADAPGIYFSNRDAAFSGGSDVTILVVTDDDLANARELAVSELSNLAASWQLPDGRVVIPSTVEPVGDASVETDHVTGDQVESFTISGQASFQALTIDPNDLPDGIEAQIRNELAGNVPAGFILTDDPLKFGAPQEGPPGSGMITVNASVDSYQALTGDLLEQIRSAATGKDPDAAAESLAAIPGITVESISVTPNVLVKTLPGTGNIEVVAR
jgi:hypothetical protein